jgi:glycosyltransferase involved in cell wall biosynthesis
MAADQSHTVPLVAQDRLLAEPGLAYVMTHYPRVALTFIAGEIDEVERHGGRIFPIVMNQPTPADLTTEEARERQRRSFYLKASPLRIAAAALAEFAAHPVKMTKLAFRAIKSARSDFGLMARRLVHLGYAAASARYCRERQIRHLHAHFGQTPATIAWFACEILNFDPDAMCTWSFTIHGFQDFVDEAVARLDLKAASASFVICVSDFTKSQLCRVTDARYWDRFHVVRCGIDLDAFPLRSPRQMRQIPRIAIVGRLSPEKGHGILLEAVAKLAREDVPVEVEIVGDGPFADAIRRQEAGLGIQDRVSHSGELLPEEVARRLADADIFCMASFSEGLPISIMEAMAIGVPVVTTWISGIPELAVNEITAMTVPPGNSDALAAAIKQLIREPELCKRLAPAARSAVERLHSQEANVAALTALFRPLTEPRVTA